MKKQVQEVLEKKGRMYNVQENSREKNANSKKSWDKMYKLKESVEAKLLKFNN